MSIWLVQILFLNDTIIQDTYKSIYTFQGILGCLYGELRYDYRFTTNHTNTYDANFKNQTNMIATWDSKRKCEAVSEPTIAPFRNEAVHEGNSLKPKWSGSISKND